MELIAKSYPAACNRQLDSRGTLYLVQGSNNFRSRPLVFTISKNY